MSKEIYNKIVQAAKNNKSICLNISDWVDIFKDQWTNAYEMPVKLQFTTEKELSAIGLYCKINNTNCYVSPIVGPGNIRVSSLAEPVAGLPDLRKNGDDKVNEMIADNWSEEIPILQVKEENK